MGLNIGTVTNKTNIVLNIVCSADVPIYNDGTTVFLAYSNIPTMVYVTVTVINKDFTLIEKPDAQRPANGMSLCRIFNDLEREGYTLVGAGGAVRRYKVRRTV